MKRSAAYMSLTGCCAFCRANCLAKLALFFFFFVFFTSVVSNRDVNAMQSEHRTDNDTIEIVVVAEVGCCCCCRYSAVFSAQDGRLNSQCCCYCC